MSKDGKENKRGKLIKRLLSLWLLAWILCVMGATVYGRVAWLGVSIVLFTIYLLSRRVPELLLNSFESKIWQPLAWGCIILAVLAWSMWLSLLSFIAQALGDVVAYELSWFFDESNGFVLQMYEYWRAFIDLLRDMLFQLIFASLFLGALVLVVAIATRILWERISHKFSPYIARLQLRLGRWLAWGRRLLLVFLLLSLGISVLAYRANQTMPELHWQSRLTGPDVPASVRKILVDDTTGMLYAATSDGVFRSADEGKSWQAASAGLQTPRTVRAMMIDDGVLYAGTVIGVFRSENGGDSWHLIHYSAYHNVLYLAKYQDTLLYVNDISYVYRSDDGGENWQAVGEILPSVDVASMLVNDDGKLYLGTTEGLLHSTDGGESWNTIGAGRLLTSTVSAMFIWGDAFYVGTTNGRIYYSDDAGNSWDATNFDLPGDPRVSTLVASEQSLYAGIEGCGLYRSDDEGNSWYEINTGLTNKYVKTLAVSGNTLYVGTVGGIFRSTDRGEHWHLASHGLVDIIVRTLVMGGDGKLYAGTPNGVFRFDKDEVRWYASSAGMWSRQILSLVEHKGILYAGMADGLIFRSDDNGNEWYSVSNGLPSEDVDALAVSSGALYANLNGEGVFCSDNGGKRWYAMNEGLPDLYVGSLVMSDGVLYTGGEGNVYRFDTINKRWKSVGTGLPEEFVDAIAVNDELLCVGTSSQQVYCLDDDAQSWREAINGSSIDYISELLVDQDDLYVAFAGGGIFRSRDKGISWEDINDGLSNTVVLSLVAERGELYAGTSGGGVYRFDEREKSWQAVNLGLASDTIFALAVKDGSLFVSTLVGGVYRSDDGGDHWYSASDEWSYGFVDVLVMDDGVLYAGTGEGVYRSDDAGNSWQAVGDGLPNSVLALLVNETALWAGTDLHGVYRFREGDGSWINVDPKYGDVHALSKIGDVLYAWVGDDYFSTDDGESWSLIKANLLPYTAEPDSLLTLARTGEKLILADTTGALWLYGSGSVHIPEVAIAPCWGDENSSGLAQPHWQQISPFGVWERYGSTIACAPLSKPAQMPSTWLNLRLLVWVLVHRIKFIAGRLGILLIVESCLLFASVYLTRLRPYRIPPWALLLPRRRKVALAQPARVDAAWPAWERALRAELLRHGDALPDDLLRVPAIFRTYTLERYAQIHAETQVLEGQAPRLLSSGRLRLLSGDRLQRWHAAWYRAGWALGARPGLPPEVRHEVDALAGVLCQVLGFTPVDGESAHPHGARDFEAVRGQRVAAPALRLAVPLHFPLLFVADPQPGARTVEMLVDAVDVLKESGYFALIVPLEPPIPTVDVAAELRQAIARSPHVQDFIVLSQDDVLDILIARHPIQALARCILSQVDLALVAPFVVNGPAPETMFFGREAEVKALVEGAPGKDFAIVGNRKIGKTSLLRRAGARLKAGGRVTVLTVDCQTVPHAADFYAEFQAQTGLALSSPTPDGFRAAIEALRESGPLPVLLLDEVDALLTLEKARGEPLTATWRALAQAGHCHFIFCGSTGLARRLDDARSVFFNFPQAMPLGYLAPKTARQVLAQPCETLGLELEEADTLLDRAVAITSGHPNLLQVLGKGLVDAANRRGERLILMEDLDALLASADFNETYLKIVWGEARPLEKLITLVAPPEGFTLPEIEAALAVQGVAFADEALDAALAMLRIYAVLAKHDRIYTFIPRAFPDILHRTQEVARLIAQEKRKWGSLRAEEEAR